MIRYSYEIANEPFYIYFLREQHITHFKYLVDLSWAGGRNSEKSLHESDLLDRHPSLVFMALKKMEEKKKKTKAILNNKRLTSVNDISVFIRDRWWFIFRTYQITDNNDNSSGVHNSLSD